MAFAQPICQHPTQRRLRRRSLILVFLLVFFLVFLFSNLFGRVTGQGVINLTPVPMLGLIAVLGFRQNIWNAPRVLNVCLLGVVVCFAFDPRNDGAGTIATLYVFAAPIVAYWAGIYMRNLGEDLVKPLLWLTASFMAYGVIQALIFNAGHLEGWLPWDAHWVAEQQLSGVRNLYQGSLLRFFGPMNSFSEYQLVGAVLVPSLWALRRRFPGTVRTRALVAVTSLHLLFLVFAMERTPILASVILYATLIRAPRRAAGALAVIVALMVSVGALSAYGTVGVQQNSGRAEAVQRLTDVVTLNFNHDYAIQVRENEVWNVGLELLGDNLFLGVGSERLASETPTGGKLRIQPHNGFMTYGLAFGIVGIVLLLAFFGSCLAQTSRLDPGVARFVRGLILTYLLVAIFNVPFTAKPGILLFLVLGMLSSTAGRLSESAASVEPMIIAPPLEVSPG